MFSEEEVKQLGEQTYFKENFQIILNHLSQYHYQLSKLNTIDASGQIVKQYLLGKGGQAHVFKGQNTFTGEDVAIKVSRSDKQVFIELKEESNILKRIKCNQNIINVLDEFELIRQNIYIQIIELCRTSLDKEILDRQERGEQFTVKEVANIIFSLINALCEIHLNNIIHFDIKPLNILITFDGCCKLADFGMAKLLSGKENSINIYGRGSIFYSSPEQFEANKLEFEKQETNSDFKSDSDIDSDEEKSSPIKFKTVSDIYSLGLTFLELIGVKLDFDAVGFIQNKNFGEIEQRINPEFKNFFTFIKYFMLQHEMDNRYSSIRLRQKFLEYFSHIIPIDQEVKRIQRIIDKYETNNWRKDKYYAYSLYLMSQTNQLSNETGHILNALSTLKKLSLSESYDHALFLQQYAQILSNKCQYQEAYQQNKKALQILENLNDVSKLEIALSYSLVAKNYQEIGMYSKSLNLYKKSLEIREALFYNDHPDISQTIADLSYTFYLLGNFQDMLEYSLLALRQRQEMFIDNHPSIAQSLNGVGISYQMLNQFEQSLEYYQNGLKMKQVIYPPIHMEIASSLGNIGNVYYLQGQLDRSLEYHLKALQIRKILYPAYNHPHLAISFENIGNNYYQLGQFKQSLNNHEIVLRIRKNVYNDINHPNIARSLDNIANCFYKLGEIQKSLEYHTKVQKIRQIIFPNQNHPDHAYSLDSIGICLQEIGQYNQAKQNHLNALNISQQLYPTDQHPQIACTLENIGNCYYKKQKYGKSLEYHLKALETRKNIYTEGIHPEVAQSNSNIGCAYRALNQHAEAIQYSLEALDLYQQFYKKNHPQIIMLYGNIGLDYKSIKEYGLAEYYYLQILEINQQFDPSTKHPLINKTFLALIDLYQATGNQEKVIYYQKQI